MTLPSLRKLQITRLSRQVWTASLALAGLAAVCLGTAHAQRPGQRYLLTFENSQPQIQLIAGDEPAADSSLDRLKVRSAQERFERLRRNRASSPVPEPMPLLEPDDSRPVPVAPPAPPENKLPRLPEIEELERNDPFLEPQRSGSPKQTRLPAPSENKLPRLPDVQELERTEPFVETRSTLHSGTANAPVPPGESRPPRLPELDDLDEFEPVFEAQNQLQPVQPAVPAPAPALMPAPPLPVNSAFQDPDPGQPMSQVPDVVRSLSDIQPNYDYQFTVKEDYLGESTGTDSTKVPDETDLPAGIYTERLSPDSLFAWEASNLYHNPLYFEDPTLERYGHVYPCVQPLVSLSRVGVQLLGLPYQTVIDTPHTKRYPLGWYRPGEPAPHLCYQVPLNPEAAAAEALAITAGFLIIP